MTSGDDRGSFPLAAGTFLAELRLHNSHEWFNAHRSAYERDVLAPAKAFVVAAGRLLRTMVPGVRAEPTVLGSIFRQLKDTRYRQSDRPYKDYVDFWFWEGDRRSAVSGFFMRLGPDFIGIGAGCHGFDSERLRTFRRAAADRDAGAALARVVEDVERLGYLVRGEKLKRMPRGFENETSRLLRYNAMYVHVDEPAAIAHGHQLLVACETHWRALSPMHAWITAHVQDSRT